MLPIRSDLVLLERTNPRPTGDLLFGAVPATAFELIDTTTLSDGIVVLNYRTDRQL